MSPDPAAIDLATKPLTGWRILTTRASKQSGGLSQPLRDLGAEVIEIPTIEIRPPENYEPLDSALKKIAHYDWLILTSVNGVKAVFERLTKLGLPASALRHLQIAAIGPATQKAIEEHGLEVAVTPEKYIAESVVEALRGKTEGKRVLLARAKVARDVLPNDLSKAGVQLDVVEAYETVIPADAQSKLQKVFASTAERPHIVAFTSSSTASNFLSLLGPDSQNILKNVTLASIGPVTSDTLRAAGFPPTVEAGEYTMHGLVSAIAAYVQSITAEQGKRH
ncbi:MAG TPA: uroporphyrinogen-III synthase [Candidatus Limnocylindrales bacterium]|nr:uroporphyrinogen-III synthase [Candidatus Limnocylindrales bacterium]